MKYNIIINKNDLDPLLSLCDLALVRLFTKCQKCFLLFIGEWLGLWRIFDTAIISGSVTFPSMHRLSKSVVYFLNDYIAKLRRQWSGVSVCCVRCVRVSSSASG